MRTHVKKIHAPSNDRRWQQIEGAMRSFGYQADALIEILHTVQELFGYLSKPALEFVATGLQVPPSKVYGVATFYHLFTLQPLARHACVVCTGTACYIKGGGAILAAVEEKTGIKPGENTPDGEISLQIARCVGPCGPAPIVVFDDEALGNLTPEATVARVEKWMHHDS